MEDSNYSNGLSFLFRTMRFKENEDLYESNFTQFRLSIIYRIFTALFIWIDYDLQCKHGMGHEYL